MRTLGITVEHVAMVMVRSRLCFLGDTVGLAQCVLGLH